MPGPLLCLKTLGGKAAERQSLSTTARGRNATTVCGLVKWSTSVRITAIRCRAGS